MTKCQFERGEPDAYGSRVSMILPIKGLFLLKVSMSITLFKCLIGNILNRISREVANIMSMGFRFKSYCDLLTVF